MAKAPDDPTRLQSLTGIRLAALASALAVVCSEAQADPCKAIPDHGRAPDYLHRGNQFTGPVVYVIDGDGLCVDVGSNSHVEGSAEKGTRIVSFPGASWVEVRIADFYAPELHEPGGPEAKAALERIAKGQAVACVADHQSYDRIVAVCTLQGVSLGDRMRAAGIVEGGRGRR